MNLRPDMPEMVARIATRAGFAPFIIPKDTPRRLQGFVAALDAQIALCARHRYDAVTDQARMDAAGWLHEHAPAARTKHLIWQWMRLFEAQMAARAEGRPLPEQSWEVPDYVPGGAS